MTSRFQGMRAKAAGVAAGLMTAFWGASALAEADKVGQPTNWAIDLQPGVTPLRDDAIVFHNYILLPVITIITLFVLALLLWCVFRYNKKSNPIPARWSHNTLIEVIWTLAPVLILVVISIFSFRLLFDSHNDPKADVTIKATGYQWYWGFEYPDQKIGEFVSNILPEDQAKAQGLPYKLATTEPLVVPVNKNVVVQVTGADVIHAFAVPSFGVIADAVPGRLNHVWFRAEKVGTYYGNCRELCGVDHAFMPIEVKVVTQPEFEAWVATKGGGKAEPAAPAAAAPAPAAATPAAAAAPTTPAPAAAAPSTTPAAPAPAPAAK